MSALLPLPPVGNIAFGFGQPGDLVPDWTRYLASLDGVIRASGVALDSLKPIPSPINVVMNPGTGFLTPPWALYFSGLDITIRSSGWDLTALRPLPPTIGWAIAKLPGGTLTQPWKEYFPSVDGIVRANT